MSNQPSVDELLGRSWDDLRDTIARTLSSPSFEWQSKRGKAREAVQSLLEHSLGVMDTLLAFAPFFSTESRPRLTSDEFLTLLLAAVAHDAGKSFEDWQDYIRCETSRHVEHVDETEVKRVAVALANALRVDLGARIEDVASCALLHDKRRRTNAGELQEWSRTNVSTRVRKLADYVNHADKLTSMPDLMSARLFLTDNPLLLGGARATSYTVCVRGVSTTYLHQAARMTFEAAGWKALLFFENGTLFAGRGPEIKRTAIEQQLRSILEKLVQERASQLPELAVGTPQGDFLPRPEYVHRDYLPQLWDIALGKVKAGKKRTTEDDEKWRKQWQMEIAKQGRLEPGAELTEVDLQALRDVGPEACAFKLAKNVFERVLSAKGHAVAQEKYNARFGQEAFKRLRSQSSYSVVQDYVLCVRPWHRLRASEFGFDGDHEIGELDPRTRATTLARVLVEITQAALLANDEKTPFERMVDEWTASVLTDLTLEGHHHIASAHAQLRGYSSLKTPASKDVELQCVQCSGLIAPNTERRQSAALGNQGSYSNKRLAFATRGSPPICPRCGIDLMIGQLSTGGLVETAIVVVPRRSLTPEAAQLLVTRLSELKDTVDRQLDPAQADPKCYVALSFPVDVLRASRSGAPVAQCVLRPVSAGTQKERLKKLTTALVAEIGEDGLPEFCEGTASPFDSFEALAKSLMDGTAGPEVRRDTDVCRAVSQSTSRPIDFAAITPNLVFVSLGNEIGGKDDSESDRAILAFALAVLIAREVDGAVAVAPLPEVRQALAARSGRTVYVPANGPARRTLRGDWLPFDQAEGCLRAVQAAVALNSSLKARSLLEILRYPHPGFTVRRLELNADTEIFWPGIWDDIRALEAFGKVADHETRLSDRSSK